MIDKLKTEYETISKLLLVAVSFLVISMTFGYYWLMLKGHSEESAALISRSIKFYYSSDDSTEAGTKISQEEKFRIASEMLAESGRPFLIVNINNGKEVPVMWNLLPVKNDPQASLEIYRNCKYEPLRLKNSVVEKNLYYLPDNLINKVRFYPLFLGITMLLIVFMTGYLYMFMRKNEKQSLWIAMSKETAHQLGTPLTSLKGWTDYISELAKNYPDLCEVENGLKDDVEKIELVVQRFSKISTPKEYKMCNPGKIIRTSADYISKRISIDSKKIRIDVHLEEVPDIYANAVLLEWTIENLLKNAIEALAPDKNGIVEISLFSEKNKIVVEISDNGSGIPSSIKKNIFDTGFTTKKRGWGLGLSLAKKVIEQYHNGSLFVKHTGREGTVLRIELDKFI